MDGRIVLENQLGQVVRTFDSHSSKFVLVKRTDTGRIEVYPSKAEIQRLGIPCEEIAVTNVTRLRGGPVSLGRLGCLKLVQSDIKKISTNVEVAEEDNERYKNVLKWTAVGHIISLALIIVIAYFLKPDAPEEPQVVTIVKQNKEPHVVTKKTVSMAKKKIPKKTRVAKKKVVAKKRAKRTSTRRKSHVKRPSRRNNHNNNKSVALNQMGAVGVLGTLNKGRRGGLNLNRIKGTAGPGLGGKAGSGGVQSTVYSKGLVSAPVGPGHNIRGGGGYGTKGQGGGNAGYGKISLAGSSAGYFQPLTQEAIVNGGLDRDQVAAVIRKNLGQIVYCYEKGLQIEPSLKGRVAVDFVIGGRGGVNTAHVAKSSLGSRRVESCIINRLKTWKFPKPVGNVNVNVTYPFILKRVNQG